MEKDKDSKENLNEIIEALCLKSENSNQVKDFDEEFDLKTDFKLDEKIFEGKHVLFVLFFVLL